MFTSKKFLTISMIVLLLGSCSSRNPIIIEELKSMSIQCLDSERRIEITDEKMLTKVLEEINNSRREGAHEMEFPEGHSVNIETVTGETYSLVLFEGGKSLMDGDYIHSNLPDFCGSE
ncbi:hypothetical protein [Psychrobacillus vulpis]|uniref:Uncharacterized protein n=1 Tax=Psychrobacillus vulpis TaxID=2325572 RepID=A0A544TVU5_9BACI|nr:hypothetical protein [Psychrobacillus vulpis]TQR21556.1 hypothetical protein FG384_00960 [Psychrobacillus vulpis]